MSANRLGLYRRMWEFASSAAPNSLTTRLAFYSLVWKYEARFKEIPDREIWPTLFVQVTEK